MKISLQSLRGALSGVAVFFALSAASVLAATTIGTDISTDGVLTITGNSSLQNVTFVNTTGTGVTTTALSFTSSSGTTERVINFTSSNVTITGGSISLGGSAVCLANGTNCPSSSGSTLSAVTAVANGSFATTTLQFYGGFLSASSTVTSTFTVVGGTTLQSTLGVTGLATFGSATATTLTANTSTIGTLNGGSGFFNAFKVTGLSVCLSDGTNCPASSAGTLSSVTAVANGSFATSTLQFYGGFLAASSTVTSTLTVIGATTLQDGLTFTNATGTTVAATGAVTGGTFNKVAITTPSSNATLTIQNGVTLTVAASSTISGSNTGDQTNPSSVRRFFRTPLTYLNANLTAASGTTYCVYLNYFETPVVIKYLEVINSATPAAGQQTAEFSIASTPLPPNKANQTVTILSADGSVQDLTTGSVVRRNITAFNSGSGYTVPAGTYTWGCVRFSMGTTQPTVAGASLDWSTGGVLTATGVGALTSVSTFTGTTSTFSLVGVAAPIMQLTMD